MGESISCITASDVAGGRVVFLDEFGNDAADALARKGAATHAPSNGTVRAVKHRFAVTKSVQRMMVAILMGTMWSQRGTNVINGCLEILITFSSSS